MLRMRRILAGLSVLLLNACATTQQMHFADFSQTDFKLLTLEPLATTAAISLGEIKGGDYDKVGEFADYSWHGYVHGNFFTENAYQGFIKLPYENPNNQVRTWLTELLTSNNLLSHSSSANKINVTVKKLKIKSQNTPGYDYRACLIELELTLRDQNGSVIRSATTEGLAKLPGASVKTLDKNVLKLSVSFFPDDPPVCKLAIANALRSKASK